MKFSKRLDSMVGNESLSRLNRDPKRQESVDVFGDEINDRA